MALPIRALFIPIGFQSIVCDPNVMFAAIEQAKKVEDKEKIIEETNDFFYFNESTRKKYDDKKLSELSPQDEFNPQVMVSQFKPNLKGNEKLEHDKLINDNVKATIKMGEESMASEFLGFSNIAFDKELNDEGKVSIVPVAFDMDYRSIVTKGILKKFQNSSIALKCFITFETKQNFIHNKLFFLIKSDRNTI